jgi:hypothetical protein
MGSLIFDDIIDRHINTLYDLVYLSVKSHGLDADDEN